MGENLREKSPVAAASRMLLSTLATLFLLTALAILMRAGSDSDTRVVSIGGELPPARVNLAEVR